MSTTPPSDPSQDRPEFPADAQPTEAYPTDAQPTQAYPSADVPPAAASSAPPAPVAPGAQPGYPQQTYAPQPTGPDTRSTRIAWTALGLAGAGLLAVLLAFLPIVWFGLVAVVLGGLLLLGAFVFSIVGLAGKKNGGKGISIAALIVSVVGGVISVFALAFALVLIGLSAADQSDSAPAPAPTSAAPSAEASGEPSENPTDEATDEAEVPAGGEAAFLADVRPKVSEIMAQVDPSATPEYVEQIFPDESLVAAGQALLLVGEDGIDQLVEQTQSQTGGDAIPAEQMRALFLAIYESAAAHLQ